MILRTVTNCRRSKKLLRALFVVTKIVTHKNFGKNRVACIIILDYLYASKSLHFVIFQVQLTLSRARNNLGPEVS